MLYIGIITEFNHLAWNNKIWSLMRIKSIAVLLQTHLVYVWHIYSNSPEIILRKTNFHACNKRIFAHHFKIIFTPIDEILIQVTENIVHVLFLLFSIKR